MLNKYQVSLIKYECSIGLELSFRSFEIHLVRMKVETNIRDGPLEKLWGGEGGGGGRGIFEPQEFFFVTKFLV